MAILTLILLGLGLLSSLAIRFGPAQAINLPNKDYWLASPERRAQATAHFLNFFGWFAFGLLALGVETRYQLILATLNPEANTNYLGFPFTIGVVVGIVGLIVVTIRRLSKPPLSGHARSHKRYG